jgi:hypothetical protein
VCVRTMRVFQSYTLRLSIAILNSPSWKPSIASHPVELPREPASRQAGRHSARVAGRQTRAQDGASGLARTVGRIEEVRVVGDLEVFAGGDDGPDHVIHAHQRAPAVLEDPSDDARLGRGYPADVQCWGQACHQLQPRRAARYEAGGWASRGRLICFSHVFGRDVAVVVGARLSRAVPRDGAGLGRRPRVFPMASIPRGRVEGLVRGLGCDV